MILKVYFLSKSKRWSDSLSIKKLSMIGVLFVSSFSPILVEAEQTVVIQDFEKEFVVQKFPADSPGAAAFSKEWKADGKQSLKIDPTIRASIAQFNLKDWSGYSRLKFSVSSTGSSKMVLRISDQQNKDYKDDHVDTLDIVAGEQTVGIDLNKEMWRGKKDAPYPGAIKTPLDLSVIKNVIFANSGTVPIFIDKIELVKGGDTPSTTLSATPPSAPIPMPVPTAPAPTPVSVPTNAPSSAPTNVPPSLESSNAPSNPPGPPVVLLQDFETNFNVTKEALGSVGFSKEWKIDGFQSLRIDPNLIAIIPVTALSLADWKGCLGLRFYLSNASSKSEKIVFQLKDRLGNKDWKDSHMQMVDVGPGEQMIEIDLTKELWRGDKESPYQGSVKTPIDLSQLLEVAFFNKGQGPIYIDKMELVRGISPVGVGVGAGAPSPISVPTTSAPVSPPTKDEKTTLLQDFEQEFPVQKYPKDSPKNISFSKEWKADGTQSLRIEESVTAFFNVMKLKDWTGYSKFKMSLSNPSSKKEPMVVQFKDSLAKGNKDCHREKVDVVPGNQTIEIDLTKELWRSDKASPYQGELKTPLDVSKITEIVISNQASVPIFIDKIELVK